MKVTLLNHTPIEPLMEATAMPYQSRKTKGLVKRVFGIGHRSIARHGMAIFLVEDVSQSLLRQISRHPHLNLTVKSTRYCDMTNTDVYLPIPNINELQRMRYDQLQAKFGDNFKLDLAEEYENDMNDIMEIYKKWKYYEGDNAEVDVAKLFLPLASTTDLVVSGNYQALYEVLQLRNCTRTEGEFRQLSLSLSEILEDLIPEIFGNMGCRGDEYGICPEVYGSCGKYAIKE